ncbi:tape measure protein [Stutzerimonas stutzeri]|uniref:tape measure protein n=1 Tax=Stutzerimonas stutzeri TaxID=316 RepID=UPI003D314D88
MEIAKYTVGLNFSLNPRSIRMVDKQIRLMENKLALMTQRMKANFDKSFALPSLKIKKIELDPLSAQRSIQGDLNRMGRLLELKVGNIRLDQAKINAQVQTTFQRAANQARLSVKTIAGAGGGGNPFPAVPRFNTLGAAGLGGGLGASLPMFGPAGIAAGAVLGGGAYAVSKANELRQLTGTRETQRLKLDTAVGDDAETRSRFRDRFINLADNLGITAESQIEGYSRFMKQAQSSGMTAEQGFDLYKNVATATRGNGGDQQSIERQAYALQQTLGVGYLRGEELNQQLADSNPAIKKFIMEAFAERTGKTGTEAFLDALSKRQVSVQDVLRGYEKSAQEAAGRVDELSNSIEGANARLQNMRFAEEMERTVSGPMSKAALEYTEAQRKLTEATQPLRDSMYNVAAAGTSLAAKFLTWGSDVIKDPLKSIFGDDETNTGGATGSWGDPVSAPEASPQPPAIRTVPKLSADWGIPAAKLEQMLAKQDPLKVLALQDVSRWKQAADSFVMPSNLLQQMSGASINSTVTVQPGAINITAHGVSEDKLVGELEGRVQGIFRHEMQSLLSSTKLEYSQKE